MQIWLKLGKNIGHFTWIPKYVLLLPATLNRHKRSFFGLKCLSGCYDSRGGTNVKRTRQHVTSICLPVYLSVYLSACLSVCLCICLSICLPVYLSVCLSICLSIDLSVCLPACLSFVCLSVWLPTCLSVCLYICLTACLSLCVSVCLSVRLPPVTQIQTLILDTALIAGYCGAAGFSNYDAPNMCV
jgi:hypothetical protein